MATMSKVALVGAMVLAVSGLVAPAAAQAPPPLPPPDSLSVSSTQTVDCAAATETLTITLSKQLGGEGLTFTIGDATITADGTHLLAFEPNPLTPGAFSTTATVTVPYGGVSVEVPYTVSGSPGSHNVGFATSGAPFDQVCPTTPPVTTPPVTVTVLPGDVPSPPPAADPGPATPVPFRPAFTG